MRYLWIFHMMIIMTFLFIAAPSVFAEVRTGQAVFKDLIIDDDGREIKVSEPVILFEGQNYLPLRAVTNNLQKSVYIDEHTNNLVIEAGFQNEEQPSKEPVEASQYRPSLKFDGQVSSNGIIIMEDNQKNVMFEKNGYSTYYPASTTKVLTALIALELGSLNDQVIVSENVNKLPSDSRRVFIQPGDALTLEQLLYGMMLYSGNDSALAIAEHIAGSEEAFAKLMNEKAKEIGAIHSNFVNPHGYHHPDHYTTPYDLALILKAASEHPLFLDIINTPVYKAVYTNKKGEKVVKTWDTTNSFLKNSNLAIDGIIGGKTGFTTPAKRTLVTVAEHNGHRYYVAALKGDSVGRYMDTRKLLKMAYQKRAAYDQEIIKNINVAFFDHSLEIGDQSIASPGQIFIYKGRTYISQSFLSQILADVDQLTATENNIKINLEPKFAFEEIVKPLSVSLVKQQNKPHIQNKLIAHSFSSLLAFSYFKSHSFMVR
ncbi:D-alanyl-D-alanine carboxypeptidase family protein [Schinkia azotoformans]|uniref:D-alanyl-D-alanine carboxypeptidase family protein n=1 Tax=Schinkia azotoformans TaxID=1454 RepID=UPI002DBAA3E2|nr:D-alanyl-D-alanine carboxypeptidase family protein [Schinkia azotoformans]MEC1717721.1 D-alanyl-D-alanine carboxypeptidase [Schinkia azotoformans]MEC1772606.1 D-alanyl-D-alanine carboxypeptidase [Schinkia azotoformans]MED4368996.1 D-alanyl-D-alanine carboxypeptidase [Schinkia azotoformans]